MKPALAALALALSITAAEGKVMRYTAISTDVRDTIRDANICASIEGTPRVIGYLPGMGWTHYDPRSNPPMGVVPELLCFALGKLPLPLSDVGVDVLVSALRSI